MMSVRPHPVNAPPRDQTGSGGHGGRTEAVSSVQVAAGRGPPLPAAGRVGGAVLIFYLRPTARSLWFINIPFADLYWRPFPGD
jgi:hypothetical protein